LIFVIFPLLVLSQSLDEKLKEIDVYAQQVVTDWKGPGMAIAIVKDDKVVFQKGYGIRELGKPEKVDQNTLFAIASNTKAFTAASLAILVDEEKLNWNDKVSKYIPEFQMYDPWVTNYNFPRGFVTCTIDKDGKTDQLRSISRTMIFGSMSWI
jgi:CubicO group peptidase (beta-lactamase class C family)